MGGRLGKREYLVVDPDLYGDPDLNPKSKDIPKFLERGARLVGALHHRVDERLCRIIHVVGSVGSDGGVRPWGVPRSPWLM